MSTRLPDWPSRLSTFVERRRRMPFKWGVNDCCQFARAAAAELLGRDPAAAVPLRGYRSSGGAARLLRKLGGVAALPPQCGFPAVRVKLAQRGDIVSIEQDGRLCLGVCLGQQCAIPGNLGLVFRPTLECVGAWKV